jgi:hypothetical protein
MGQSAESKVTLAGGVLKPPFQEIKDTVVVYGQIDRATTKRIPTNQSGF